MCTKATSSAIEHLYGLHQLSRHGRITVERSQPSTPSQGTQGRLDAYYIAGAAAERNRATEAFDHERFEALVTRQFTVEQIPLQKADSAAFRDLLIYLN